MFNVRKGCRRHQLSLSALPVVSQIRNQFFASLELNGSCQNFPKLLLCWTTGLATVEEGHGTPSLPVVGRWSGRIRINDLKGKGKKDALKAYYLDFNSGLKSKGILSRILVQMKNIYGVHNLIEFLSSFQD